MKISPAAGLVIGATLLAALPALADTCMTGCNIRSKTPSASQKGQFDYTLSCIRDTNGNELIAKVTAATDALAKALALEAVLIAPKLARPAARPAQLRRIDVLHVHIGTGPRRAGLAQ